MNPLFSIVCPLYNKETTVVDCVQSILKQDFEDFELIVVDDGSTDKSREKLSAVVDSRFNLLEQANSGPSAARNAGARIAHGKYLIFLDMDDILLEGALREFSELISAFDHAPLIYAAFEEIDYQGHHQTRYPLADLSSTPLVSKSFRSELTQHIQCGSYCVSRELFQQVDGFNTDLYCWEVTELLIKLQLNTDQSIVSNTAVMQARRQPENSQFLRLKTNRQAYMLYVSQLTELLPAIPAVQRLLYQKELDYLLFEFLNQNDFSSFKTWSRRHLNLIHDRQLRFLSTLPTFLIILLLKLKRMIRRFFV